MTITLKPDLEAYAQEQARERGLEDVSTYVNQLIEDQKSRRATAKAKAREWIQRFSGTATSGLTTDEIMEMTRSEV